MHGQQSGMSSWHSVSVHAGVLPGAFAQDLPAAIDQRVQKPQQQQQQQPLVSADAQVLPGTTDQQASTAQCQNNSSSNSLAGMAAHSQPYIRSHQSTHVSPRSSNNSSSGRRQYMGQQEEVHEALSSAFAARNRQTYHGLNSLSGAASSPPDAANTADAATRDSQGLTRVAATTRTSACSRRSAHGEGALQSRSGRRLRTR